MPVPTFALLHRALHVYSAALRVEEFASLCASAQKLSGGLISSSVANSPAAGPAGIPKKPRKHVRSVSSATFVAASASQVLNSLMNASHELRSPV